MASSLSLVSVEENVIKINQSLLVSCLTKYWREDCSLQHHSADKRVLLEFIKITTPNFFNCENFL